jgi:beta-lactamase regulating signal transducer with metallopeptidase domain
MNPLHWLSRPELAALALALVHFLWQGTLIALLLAAAVRAFRIKRAAQRYACSLAALLAMAICPLITYLAIGPQWDAPVAAMSLDEPTIAGENLLSSESAASGVVSWWQTAAALAHSVQPYLLGLWLVGVMALGLRLVGGFIGVVRLTRHKLPLPLELAARVEQLGKVLRIDALPRVFLSRAVSEALVVGFWRPVVLVPAAWAADMPLGVLEAIIAHELAHIRRLDLWVNLLQRVVETLLFYHPAVWWVSRRLSQEREMCCDELAVGVTGRRIEYAETLELVARERLAGVRPALAAGIRGESNMKLLARVRNVLGGPAGESFGLWPAGLLAMLLPLALWTVTFGVLSPSPAAAVAADDDRDDDDGYVRSDDDDDDDDGDDEKGDRKSANRERDDDDDDGEKEGRKAAKGERDDDDEAVAEKKEVLRKFLESRKEAGEDGDRKEGDAPKKERKEGDAPKKERKEGEQPKKIIKEGDQPKKVVKEGDQPKKVIKDGDQPKKVVKEGDQPKKIVKEGDQPKKVVKEGDQPKKVVKEGDQPKKVVKEGEEPRKDPIKKVPMDKEAEGKPKPKIAILAAGKGEGAGELLTMVKELRGEVEKLRAEVRELRGGKTLGDGETSKFKELSKFKAEGGDKEALIKKLRDAKEAAAKEKGGDKEAAQRNELEAREKARAAEREAAERKEREIKERQAAERKEAERKEADKKERPDKQ